MYSRIAGTGSYLPEKILTNADLEKLVDTSDEWIRTPHGYRAAPRGCRRRDDDRSCGARGAPCDGGGGSQPLRTST